MGDIVFPKESRGIRVRAGRCRKKIEYYRILMKLSAFWLNMKYITRLRGDVTDDYR
jgi:hypothetical protein